MSVDLSQKVAHLCRDFRAVLAFVEFIPYELEKRIVARLGLVKIEALASIAGAFKNELKRSVGATKAAEVAHLETLLTQLRKDVDDGIRDNRNAQIGHSLKLSLTEIPEQWLFMGHSTFGILKSDIDDIEAAIKAIDPSYTAAAVPPLPGQAVLADWAANPELGPPGGIRFAQVYAGPWTPDIMAMMPGGSLLQDATIRVMGLRLMIRQAGLLLMPFLTRGQQDGIWSRLLMELALIDFVSLEEAVFAGNAQGGTPSLVDEWTAASHAGVNILMNGRTGLPFERLGWKDSIRNKVCAHMDLNVASSLLDMSNWPMNLGQFDRAVSDLCGFIGQAALNDIRTEFLGKRIAPVKNALKLAGLNAPKWSAT